MFCWIFVAKIKQSNMKTIQKPKAFLHDEHKNNPLAKEGIPTPGIRQTVYYCPMRCEGDKTYDEPGDCPKCGMHLIKVAKTATPGKGLKYTCSMHPEIIRDEPGDCPKCGMELVPVSGEVKSEEEKAYKRMAKRFWIALAFSVPVFIIAMSDYIPFPDLKAIAPVKFWGWVQFLLASPVLFYSSRIFFVRGWSSIRRWNPNMWTLISIGVGAAYLFSVFGLLFPGMFPDQFKDAQGNVHLYFEAAVIGNALRLRKQ